MAINPNFSMSWTLIDRSNEVSRSSINYDPSALTSDVGASSGYAEIDAYEADVVGFLTNGDVASRNETKTTRISNVIGNGTGNREDRWLLRYQDNVTLKTYNTQVACRDNSLQTIAGTDRLDPDEAVNVGYAAMKNAFEGLARSVDGNAVTLLEVLLLGGR